MNININDNLINSFGLERAVVISKLQYFIKRNKAAGRNFKEGRFWTYNSMEVWQKDFFSFMSLGTLRRIFKDLEDSGLLISGNFNRVKSDRTKWYTINEEKLDEVAQQKLKKKVELRKKRSDLARESFKASNKAFCSNDKSPKNLNTISTNEESNLLKSIPIETTTKTITSSSSSERILIDYFEANICELKRTTTKHFIDFIKTTKNIDLVKAIIDYQSSINTRSYEGFKKAIENFKDIKTVDELNLKIEKFRASKKKSRKNATSPSPKKTLQNFSKTKDPFLEDMNKAILEDLDWSNEI